MGNRTHRPDVEAITTAKLTIELAEGQTFYETNTAYEIWDENPLRRVHRIPKKRVYWVASKEEADDN